MAPGGPGVAPADGKRGPMARGGRWQEVAGHDESERSERTSRRAMRVIGIVGGVASGKSRVAEQLRGLGAVVLDADRAGHEVLHEEEVRRALRERWGEEIFNDRGEIHRAAVARIVFAAPPRGPRERTFLEQITHPRIGARLREQAAEAERRGAPAVVLDAALLLEAGWHSLCDHILFVSAPRDLRWRRARQRGWSEAEFRAREAAQLPVEEKRRRAEHVIDNSGSEAETDRQVRRWWRSRVTGSGP